MNRFKFLEYKIPRTLHQTGRDRSHYFPRSGTHLFNLDVTHSHFLNHITHGQYSPFAFWWSSNYELWEQMNDRTTGFFEIITYEGPIHLFQQSYINRRINAENGFFTKLPVIRHIMCNGIPIDEFDVKFSHDDMLVEIQYKKFLS